MGRRKEDGHMAKLYDKVVPLQVSQLLTTEFIDTLRMYAAINKIQLPSRDREVMKVLGEVSEVWLRSNR